MANSTKKPTTIAININKLNYNNNNNNNVIEKNYEKCKTMSLLNINFQFYKQTTSFKLLKKTLC